MTLTKVPTMTASLPRRQVNPRRPRLTRRATARRQPAQPSVAWGSWLVLVFLFGIVLKAGAGEPLGRGGLPTKAVNLFEAGKVWTLHLRMTPERWAELEPKGGPNPADSGGFGFGMFLAPPMMRDGDRDQNQRLSASEFRELGERWFAAWDRTGAGALDSKQIRQGLRGVLTPPGMGGGADGRDGPPPGMVLQGRDGKRNGLSSMMGIDFEYVHADLEFEGMTFADVAVRYKGNGTFLEARGSLKRSLKIDLNKYVKGQKLAGVTTLNLHNNITDAGMMNEVISYQLYRDAGVPAPRTAYARVFVTVPGKHERQYLGLYSLVENVDKNFVADRKLGASGALFKPSMPDLFANLGDDWKAYQQGYDPKTDLTPEQERRVIAFSRLVATATDGEFAARLGDFVDLDEFARFLAVTVWIGDLDSILTAGQNYYLFLDPKGSRFQFIPWDKDHTFGSWIAGSREDQEGHSIRQPWEGRKRFLERAFQVEAFRARYLAAMAKFAADQAQPEQIAGHVKHLAATIRPAVSEESPQKVAQLDEVVAGRPLPGGPFGSGKEKPTLLMFAKGRAASVQDQLAGRSEGRVYGKKKPGEPKGSRDFRPEEVVEPTLLKALDADKDKQLSREELVGGFSRWFVGWDAGSTGGLSEEQLRKGLNQALPFSFFGPPKPDEKAPDPSGPAIDDRAPR